MSRTKIQRVCDFKTCSRTRGVTSLTIMEQSPYKKWFTIHGCHEHLKILNNKIKELLKTSVTDKLEIYK